MTKYKWTIWFSCSLLLQCIFTSCETADRYAYEASEAIQDTALFQADSLYSLALEIDTNQNLLLNKASLALTIGDFSEVRRFTSFIELNLTDSILINNVNYLDGSSFLINYFYNQNLGRNLLDSITTLNEEIALLPAKEQLTQMNAAEPLREQIKQIDKESKQVLNKSENAFKQALIFQSNDTLSRYNLAIVKMLKYKPESAKNDQPESQEPSEFALEAKKMADKMLSEFQFEAALGLMQQALQKDKSVEHFKQFMTDLESMVTIIQQTKDGQ